MIELSTLDYVITDKTQMLDELQKTFQGFHGWFIAGSFANDRVTTPGDIDIYFYSNADYLHAKSILAKEAKNPSAYQHQSKFADTYYLSRYEIPIQCITKIFGTPQEIFDTMDINVCKQAFIHDGRTHTADVTATDPLALIPETMAIDSIARYLKYYKRYNPKRNLDKAFCYLFDNFLEDDRWLDNYYAPGKRQALNKSLYALFKTHAREGTKYMSRRVKNLLTERIQDSVPELLV